MDATMPDGDDLGTAESGMHVPYGFRQAYEANAFHQFPLLDPRNLRGPAVERGLRLRIDPYEQLEWLDEAGAFCPILFEADDTVYRDEHDFVPWERYAVDDLLSRRPRAQPRYSPWQLLYLKEALSLDKAEVPPSGCLTTRVGKRAGGSCRAGMRLNWKTGTPWTRHGGS